ncbi:MAG: cytochrome-c oxidase, cbb3-type subunit II [Alphaproteobacteria bacterium]|nr:cytochrome-c oxidase, cbb3-type subunit II [Alphaproteobacteria bacterium]
MQETLERNGLLLIIVILITIAVGGLVQIVPLHTIENTIEKVEGMRPYTPLELKGRGIYVREGCYLCHSQMIRPFRDEVERYGHYSLAAESMYDHPFQWGSKRTGPDLARVGGKYSNAWHSAHIADPRSVVPESIMPGYPFMVGRELSTTGLQAEMEVLRVVGVPYTDDMIANAMADLQAQANPDMGDAEAMAGRYPKAGAGDFDGDPSKITEMDALVAYLQVLGTMVDTTSYQVGPDGR